MCGTPGITPSVGLQQSFRGGLWGGDGFVLQKLEGQGPAWIELSGELVHYTLARARP
ncbi:MAG: AIM24 family protein [Streptosporangiaceae bacterium]